MTKLLLFFFSRGQKFYSLCSCSWIQTAPNSVWKKWGRFIPTWCISPRTFQFSSSMESMEDQHVRRERESCTVMAERKHAMGENLFRRPGSNHVQQRPPRKRRLIIHLPGPCPSITCMPMDQLTRARCLLVMVLNVYYFLHPKLQVIWLFFPPNLTTHLI